MKPATVLKYVRAARILAHSVARKVPRRIEVDDLIGAANLGLADALAHHGDLDETAFEKYVVVRMQGAILDELRSRDHLSRDERTLAYRVRAAEAVLEHELGRETRLEDIAELLDESVERLVKHWRIDTAGSCQKELQPDQPDSTYGHDWAEERYKLALVQSLRGRLPERLQRVLTLYYEEGLTLKQIGEWARVTESRVSQLHSEAIRRLKDEASKEGLLS